MVSVVSVVSVVSDSPLTRISVSGDSWTQSTCAARVHHGRSAVPECTPPYDVLNLYGVFNIMTKAEELETPYPKLLSLRPPIKAI